MRKLLVMMLVAALALPMCACSKGGQTASQSGQTSSQSEDGSSVEDIQNEDEDKLDENEEETAVTEKEEEKPAAKPQKEPEVNSQATPMPTPAPAPAPAGNIADSVVADFKAKVAAGQTSPDALANALLDNSALDFAGATMAVEPGYLNGFSADITGFSQGAMFGPAIGTIPFIGYVFKLSNASEASAFMRNLKSSADPRWNICTQADDMSMDAVGDLVVFVMSPSAF